MGWSRVVACHSPDLLRRRRLPPIPAQTPLSPLAGNDGLSTSSSPLLNGKKTLQPRDEALRAPATLPLDCMAASRLAGAAIECVAQLAKSPQSVVDKGAELAGELHGDSAPQTYL